MPAGVSRWRDAWALAQPLIIGGGAKERLATVAPDRAAFLMRSAPFASRVASGYSRATQQGTSFSMAMSAASPSAPIQRASHCQHVLVSLIEPLRLIECLHGGFSR